MSPKKCKKTLRQRGHGRGHNIIECTPSGTGSGHLAIEDLEGSTLLKRERYAVWIVMDAPALENDSGCCRLWRGYQYREDAQHQVGAMCGFNLRNREALINGHLRVLGVWESVSNEIDLGSSRSGAHAMPARDVSRMESKQLRRYALQTHDGSQTLAIYERPTGISYQPYEYSIVQYTAGYCYQIRQVRNFTEAVWYTHKALIDDES